MSWTIRLPGPLSHPQVAPDPFLWQLLPCTPCQPQLLVSLFKRFSSVPPSLLPFSSSLPPASLPCSLPPVCLFSFWALFLVGSQVAVALPSLSAYLSVLCPRGFWGLELNGRHPGASRREGTVETLSHLFSLSFPSSLTFCHLPQGHQRRTLDLGLRP